MSRPGLQVFRYVGLVFGCLLAAPFALAEGGADPFADADLDNAADINEVCAGCHGEHGQGGKDGEYPRLAGLPAAFISRQLDLFRVRERDAVPMLAGQYTGYLQRQVDKLIDKRRVHDPSDPEADELLAAFSAEELRDIFAYVSILDD